MLLNAWLHNMHLHVLLLIRFEEEARCTCKRKGLFFGLCMEAKPNKSFVLVRIVKRKLSSGMQTSSVEAFHSVVNHFAPKLLSFSYEGMCSRYVISLVGQCYCKCFVLQTLHPPL